MHTYVLICIVLYNESLDYIKFECRYHLIPHKENGPGCSYLITHPFVNLNINGAEIPVCFSDIHQFNNWPYTDTLGEKACYSNKSLK